MKTDKIIKNILGKPNKNDWDGDGVPNKKDCQPRNVMRQDAIGDVGLQRIDNNLNDRASNWGNKPIGDKI